MIAAESCEGWDDNSRKIFLDQSQSDFLTLD